MNQRISCRIGLNVLSSVLVLAMAASPARADEKARTELVKVTVVSTEFTGEKVGTVVRRGPVHLSLREAGSLSVMEVPLRAIAKVEVRSVRRSTKKGFTIGLLIGGVSALLGAPLAAGSTCYRYPENSGPIAAARNRECDTQGRTTRLAIAALVVGPSAIGAGLGHLKKSESWSEVPLERFKVSVRPERGGGRVGVSLSF